MVHDSSGNVFADMQMVDAEQRLAKAELARIVRSSIRERELTQSEAGELTQARAAKLFGVTQPRVSDLVRGKIELFSIDALVNMLASAGHHVRVSVQPPEDQAA